MKNLIQLIGKNVYSEAKSVFTRFPSLRKEIENFAPEQGMPPEHYLSSEDEGVQFQLSAVGQIQVIFIYGVQKDGFLKFAGQLIRDLSFKSQANEIEMALGEPNFYMPAQKIPGLDNSGEVIRYDFQDYSVHFQLKVDGKSIELITIMAPDQVP